MTIYLGSSSQLPGSCRRAGGVLLERPQPRSGEDERAGRRQAAAHHGERGRIPSGLSITRGRAGVPGVRWAEWSHKHPFGVLPVNAGGCHDHVSGDRAAQSCDRAGLVASSCRWSELPGVWRPFPVWMPAGAGRSCALPRLGAGEQVVGAGEELAGDRGGGDLVPAAFSDGAVGGRELRGALGGLGRLVQNPPQPRRALLGDVPVPDSTVRAAHGRGQPSPGWPACGRFRTG